MWMALASPANAAAGDLDPTFGIGGRVTTNFTSREDVAYPVAFQADGRIVVAGTSAFGKFALARYETDGSLDTSFGRDGKVITDFGPSEDIAYGLVIQSDGKIVAAGTSGYAEFALARYETDGSLDMNFGDGGRVTTDFTARSDFAYGLVLQADGKVVAVGDAGCCGPRTRFALARYDTDGSLDTSFGGDGKVTTDFTPFPDDGLAVAIQGDGKIVAVGGAGFGGPNEKFALARYDTDGSLDTSFGGDGKLTTDFTPKPDVAFSVAIQADGNIVAAGTSHLGPGNPRFALARYEPDGSLDTTFDGNGKLTTDFTRGDDDGYSLAFQADGKIVVAGQAGSRNTKFALARYETDGSLDPTFGGDGRLTTDFTRRYDSVYQVVIQADGKIVAAGTAGFAKFALARYLAA
jgi:uncharacterized delta-60 repeat protein